MCKKDIIKIKIFIITLLLNLIFFSCTSEPNSEILTDKEQEKEIDKEKSIIWSEAIVEGTMKSYSWNTGAVSANGINLVATHGTEILTSSDRGLTWLKKNGIDGVIYDSITISDDGLNLAMIEYGGYIYTSKDGGETWITHVDMGERNWLGITSSSDGTKIAVCVYHGYIYTSMDGGETWSEQTGSEIRGWHDISGSSDCIRLAAVSNGEHNEQGIYNANNVDYIYTSIDGGINWTKQTGAGGREWNEITSSSDGLKLAALSTGRDYIHTSKDGGITWTEHIEAGRRNWKSITISSNGLYIAAAVAFNESIMIERDYIFFSIDGGSTWTENTELGTGDWQCIASSSDFSTIVALNKEDFMHTSSNGGATWIKHSELGKRRWCSITSSSDGNRLAACDFENYIYTSTDGGKTWTEQTAAGQRSWKKIISSDDGLYLSAFCFTNSDYINACDYYDIYISSDGGQVWEKSRNIFTSLSDLAFSSDGLYVASTKFKFYDSEGDFLQSSDYGITWESIENDKSWKCITSSANGLMLAAGVDNGYIYTSSDGGRTWIKQTGAGVNKWQSITSSADGLRIAAGAGAGLLNDKFGIYTSADGGKTWIKSLDLGVKLIASSADGSKLATIAYDTNYIYTSFNGGETWSEQTGAGNKYWKSITISDDGQKYAAVASNENNISIGVYE
ncbi:MAG: hypothetical protein JW822_12755 [Spirochaetales bacterium]|nr:hypothetical protein [Spirochaetales bacterium]